MQEMNIPDTKLCVRKDYTKLSFFSFASSACSWPEVRLGDGDGMEMKPHLLLHSVSWTLEPISVLSCS